MMTVACGAPVPTPAPEAPDTPTLVDPTPPPEPTAVVEEVPKPDSPDSDTLRVLPASWGEGDRSRFAGALQAPPPVIVRPTDTPFRFADHRGDVVLVMFWAEWSQPSLRELQVVQDLHESHPELAIIALGSTRGGAAVMETAAKLQLTFPVAVDDDDRTANAFQVDGYPDYYLIDKWGRLRLADCANASLKEAVEALLSE